MPHHSSIVGNPLFLRVENKLKSIITRSWRYHMATSLLDRNVLARIFYCIWECAGPHAVKSFWLGLSCDILFCELGYTEFLVRSKLDPVGSMWQRNYGLWDWAWGFSKKGQQLVPFGGHISAICHKLSVFLSFFPGKT